jgi:hypothetical protein
MIQLGAMPLPRFLSLHQDSRVTPEELATLKAITICTDPHTHTTAMLYGNDEALRAVHPRETDPGSPKYPAGAVLALITQRTNFLLSLAPAQLP